MTRVVVQRGLAASGASQNRTGTTLPSSSSSSSTNVTPPSGPGLHALQPSPQLVSEEGTDQEGSRTEVPSHLLVGEALTSTSFEGNARVSITCYSDGKEHQRELAHDDGLTHTAASSKLGIDSEDKVEGRAEEEPGFQLSPVQSSGEAVTKYVEHTVPSDERDSSKGKEVLLEESQPGRVAAEIDRQESSSVFGDSGPLQQRGPDDYTASRKQVSATRSQNAPPNLPQSVMSVPFCGHSPAPNSSHYHYGFSSDSGSVLQVDQARPSTPSGSEVVGCSYLATSTASPPSPSLVSRRGTWVGPSGSGATRGGLSRRNSRTGKPSRNSPDSSRPTSPKSFGEGDGYNSADEQNPWSSGSSAYEDSEQREHQFDLEIRRMKNLEVRRMADDGNCLFRAVADQVYGDAEMYDETRQMCIDYMEKERDHFSQFVTESFTAYCKRKRRDKVYGNNLEIQAMAEMYNRPIHIYAYSMEPINIFHGSYETDLPPIRLSYHRGNHYNSLQDPSRPAVGAGLGFSSFRGVNVDREQVKAALKAQQDQQIEKALLAEGRFYSDMELTEQEMERMVMEASRAEFLEEEKHRHHAPINEQSSTSAAAEPSSSGTTDSLSSAVSPMSLAASSTAVSDSGLTSNMRMLMSMGFSYLQVMEACSIFGDDVNNVLCYLLETGSNSFVDGESIYRMKGKAAER